MKKVKVLSIALFLTLLFAIIAVAEMPEVELYTVSWCPVCKKARNFFRSRGIPFTEYDIEKDKSAARRKRQLDTRKGVPLAIINGQLILGFSETAYVRALVGREEISEENGKKVKTKENEDWFK